MFADHTVFMTFGHSKLVDNRSVVIKRVSYHPLTAHFCFTAPLEFLNAPCPLWEPWYGMV